MTSTDDKEGLDVPKIEDVEDDSTDPSEGRCSASAPFGDIRPVPGVNTADEEIGATFTRDELTLILARMGPDGNSDLYTASRPSLDEPFGPLIPLTEVNSERYESGPTIADHGLTLCFHMSRDNDADIFCSNREDPTSPFGPPFSAGTRVNTGLVEDEAYFGPSNLYFTRNGVIHEETGWGANALDDLVDLMPTFAPTASADDLELFFARVELAGGLEMWVARRPDVTEEFQKASPVVELNSPESRSNIPEWISPDGCRIYFTSDRSGGAGGTDLWQATRAR